MSRTEPSHESSFSRFASNNLYLVVYIAIVSLAILLAAIGERILR